MNDDALSIGVIGGGWRTESFLRVADALPDRFRISRVFARSERSAKRVASVSDVAIENDLQTFLSAGGLDFVVIAIPRESVADVLTQVAPTGLPVLLETPPARDADELAEIWSRFGSAPIEVAEQYPFQPYHAARTAIIGSGILGEVNLVRVSAAHEYHATSLMRPWLGVGLEPAEITASVVEDPVLSVRDIDGWHEPREAVARRITAVFRFGSRTGFYDFADPEQYVSPIRSKHVSIHGTRGEMIDDSVSYLVGDDRIATARIARDETGREGDLDGKYLNRLALGEQVVYENPYRPARLNDDELAIAETLSRMGQFVATGEHFYSLAEGCHDQYLSALMLQAASTGEKVVADRLPWAL
jgi:predicted dehydrogenase